MHRKTAALLGALLLTPSVAFAQHSGTQAEQDACTPDVFRLCQEYIPDEAPILACLKRNHAQLSAACEPVIFPPSEKAATPATIDETARKAVRHKRKKRHHSRSRDE